MKILMISSGFPPKVNSGAEKLCYELTKRLIQKGLEVEVATDTNLKVYKSIKLHKLFKVQNKYVRKFFFDYFNPLNIVLIKKIMDEIKPDIVHFHNIYGISTQLIDYISKRYPAVITVHDYWPFCFNSTMLLKGKICNMNCNFCRFPLGFVTQKIKAYHLKKSYFVAPSNFMKKKLIFFGYKNVETIYNGIDIPNEKTDHTTNRVVYIGRVSYEKGILFFLNIVKNTNIESVIIGDGPLLPHLRNEYSIYKNIHFKGFVENIYEELIEGGIVVVPSIWHENLPYVILEAMSYGCTVLASDLGGISEIIKDGKTGFLFKSNDMFDFIKKLLKIINNYSLRKSICEASRKQIRYSFNWDLVVEKYIYTYNDLINKHHIR